MKFTPRAKKALDQAKRIAKKQNTAYIGTEHILAGLLREDTGVASQVLQGNGVSLEHLMELISDLIAPQSDVTLQDMEDILQKQQKSCGTVKRKQSALEVRKSEQSIF